MAEEIHRGFQVASLSGGVFQLLALALLRVTQTTRAPPYQHQLIRPRGRDHLHYHLP